MDLSALGLPMEQLRDVWLIAFMVYLGLCLLVDIAYPVPIKKEKAADLYLEVSGSPVDEARRATAERTAMGAPLSSSRKGSATKKAKKKLDSIEGAGVFSGWFHTVMYLWGWIVAVSIFTLYWDIVYDGILLPALLLPFLMVYCGARWGRRHWREARGYSKDDRVLGMPRIYSATLGKLSAPFRVRGTVPGVEPIREDRTVLGAQRYCVPARLGLLDFVGRYERRGLGINLYRSRFLVLGGGVHSADHHAADVQPRLRGVQPGFVPGWASAPSGEVPPLL